MNKNTSSPENKIRHDESVEDIMASIMESISQEHPSPFDQEHKALTYQAEQLQYDNYTYDAKPAVILGQCASNPASFYDGSESQVNEQTSEQTLQSSETTEDTLYADEQVYSTAEMNAIQNQVDNSADIPAIQQTTSFGTPFVNHELETTSSIPYIPPQAEGQEQYQVEFDFGDSKAPFSVRSLPYLLYTLVVVALAAILLYNPALVPLPAFSIILMGVSLNETDALFVGLGVFALVVGLLFAIVSCLKSKEKVSALLVGLLKTCLVLMITLIAFCVVHFADILLTIV